jgi:hypothetical protein
VIPSTGGNGSVELVVGIWEGQVPNGEARLVAGEHFLHGVVALSRLDGKEHHGVEVRQDRGARDGTRHRCSAVVLEEILSVNGGDHAREVSSPEIPLCEGGKRGNSSKAPPSSAVHSSSGSVRYITYDTLRVPMTSS